MKENANQRMVKWMNGIGHLHDECKFCCSKNGNNEPIKFKGIWHIYVDENNELQTHCLVGGALFDTSTPIKFCPMCGRKLK